MTLLNTSMHGKTCLITGATGGLGKATATHLARMGAQVVIVGRNSQRIDAAIKEIREKTGSTAVTGLRGDLSVRTGVDQVCDQFLARFNRLDLLVNNVGVTLLSYHTTHDGLEMVWALNYLYHFYLTNRLLDKMKSTASRYGEARILEITSSMFRFASGDFSKRQGPQGYNGVQSYAQSKRAIMVFTCEMDRRLRGSGVTINAVTPGFVATNVAAGDVAWARWAMRIIRMISATPEKGVEPIVHMGSAPELCEISGAYYQRWRRKRLSPAISGEQAGQTLWSLSESQLSNL